MIEVPRAALIADEVSCRNTTTLRRIPVYKLFLRQIAELAEFFSFGTNDLTQMTFGYSRDDVGKFLPVYISKGILQSDPFEVIPSVPHWRTANFLERECCIDWILISAEKKKYFNRPTRGAHGIMPVT